MKVLVTGATGYAGFHAADEVETYYAAWKSLLDMAQLWVLTITAVAMPQNNFEWYDR